MDFLGNLPNWAQTVLIGGALALILGFFVSRKAIQSKPIQGGRLAHFFHYLGSVAAVSPPLLVLIGSFVYRLPFGQSASLCIGSLASGFVLLMVFAVFELRSGGHKTA